MNNTEQIIPGSLRANLNYEPQALRFGTSGRRGLVKDLTQLEIYINASAELEYLLSLPKDQGGIQKGDQFFYAEDLRPSSTQYVPAEGGRGEIAQAIEKAIADAGMVPVNLGQIPTPALTSYAIERGLGSIMVTGSHIPFDRNGYKTNTSLGELLKKDEAPINERVAMVRKRLYDQPYSESLFNESGLFKTGSKELEPAIDAARKAYVERYKNFFPPNALHGKRILAYQHSAVGRDILVGILKELGAEVIPAGRSETFVPIDTENIDDVQLKVMQDLADNASAKYGKLDALVSTDGDSDRPLILGISPDGKVRFFGGDLVGMLVAEYLKADGVVVPISSNDAIDRGVLKDSVEPKTKIGSPFVIAGMQKARAKGRNIVCGWEANGGFLTGCDIVKDARILKALPTRDAILPILGILVSASEAGISVVQLFDKLPQRFSKAALLKNFPRPVSMAIVEKFSPADPVIRDVFFNGSITVKDEDGKETAVEGAPAQMAAIREELSAFFTTANGFGNIVRINYIDGVRIYFDNGDVAHIRPSGNADELRIYAVSDNQKRADEIAKLGVEEPNGILRQLEKAVGGA